ncbi:HAMP domain-containing sensor histidine kinase [Egicoccus halophilus]|uniref:histidine kinase n=1 Tax=Egicoccus halophilus TaxID=1670830 RepID=A0A8J3AEL7_9ACTN|nr:HAMP domain-containing sensor histidine kinase [Egicoccus halophilus]GGI07117.1 two-component sensor histidine kinase [Egicoccus halophilus]
MRPLDRVGSLKLKLGLVIVAAVLVTVAVTELGRRAGWPTPVVAVIAVAAALAMVQVLAHGMTFPLRQMSRAVAQLAAGERHDPVVATSHDEVGDLARAFNAMAEEIAQTDRLRRDLVANVSHELRTPVAALRAGLENLADGVEDADPATLQRLVRQTERLQALVEALLDLSRLESGVVDLDVRTHRVRDLVDEAVELVTATAGPPGAADVAIAVDPPELVLAGDERRLVQVLVNLLVNARTHAPPGSDVEVAARLDDGEVLLTVTDRGPGIAAGDAEHVFERFSRSPASSAMPDGGTGLGLAITRWIVALHGGRIRVDTDHLDGCRMEVRLPDDPLSSPRPARPVESR